MAKNIVIIQGHPDPAGEHLCHALGDAYARGALDGGRSVRRIEVAKLDVPFLRTAAEFESGSPPDRLATAQADIQWAHQLLIVYPLWLGTMPAMLKAFFEQTLRPGFGFEAHAKGWPRKLLKHRTARIVITMGMPSFAYRWYYGAHSLKSLERNILKFCGIGPIQETLFGMVDMASETKKSQWLKRMSEYGKGDG